MSTPAAEHAFRQVRREIRDALGAEVIAQLHARNALLDNLAVLGALAAFAGGIAALGSWPLGPAWLLLFVAQGFLLQVMGLVSHDVFVHRRIWGDTGSWLGSLLLTLPRLSLPTGYEQAHLAHHRCIGTPEDTEAYKQHLDTRGRRLLFLTVAGVKLAQRGRLAAQEGLRAYHDVSGQGAAVERRARIERWLFRLGMLALVLLALRWPRLVLLGYLLPVLVMGPIVNTLRIVIEHAEADPANPWHWSTCYRTGWLTRPLFFWDGGDCHLVHHIFPRLPFYRMNRAVALMRPLWLAHGVTERRSYWQLLHGWLVAAWPHRSRWPIPDPSTATREST